MFWGPNRLPWRSRTPRPRRQRSPQGTETDSPCKQAQLPVPDAGQRTAVPGRFPWAQPCPPGGYKQGGSREGLQGHHRVTSVPRSAHRLYPVGVPPCMPQWEGAGQEAEHRAECRFRGAPSAPPLRLTKRGPAGPAPGVCARRHRAWPAGGGRGACTDAGGGCRGHCAGQPPLLPGAPEPSPRSHVGIELPPRGAVLRGAVSLPKSC